jgi:hypothetical protein
MTTEELKEILDQYDYCNPTSLEKEYHEHEILEAMKVAYNKGINDAAKMAKVEFVGDYQVDKESILNLLITRKAF